jgi:hypothetical protein
MSWTNSVLTMLYGEGPCPADSWDDSIVVNFQGGTWHFCSAQCYVKKDYIVCSLVKTGVLLHCLDY